MVASQSYIEEMSQQRQQRKSLEQNRCEVIAPDPTREIIMLSDIDRNNIITWHNKYFGELKIERSIADNMFSHPKITIDNMPPHKQGTDRGRFSNFDKTSKSGYKNSLY